MAWAKYDFKWWIEDGDKVNPNTNNPAPKHAREGMYLIERSINDSAIKIDHLGSDYSFLGSGRIDTATLETDNAAVALNAPDTGKVFGNVSFFHANIDRFPGVFSYKDDYYISAADVHTKFHNSSVDAKFYRRRFKKAKWALSTTSPYIQGFELKYVWTFFAKHDSPLAVIHTFPVYKLIIMIAPNVVGPNDLFPKGYTFWGTGNSMACVNLGEQTTDPVYPNVHDHTVVAQNCESETVFGAKDCTCATAFDKFYNGTDSPWFENIVVGGKHISAINWINYASDKYRASFIDASVPLAHGVSPLGSQSPSNITIDSSGNATMIISGLYYCPLTVWGYPVDLSQAGKWIHPDTLERQVVVNFTEPFFSSVGGDNRKFVKPYPSVNGKPSAPQMIPSFMWNKPVVVTKCHIKHAEKYYYKYRKQFIDPYKADDKEVYNAYIKTYSKDQWMSDIETKTIINNLEPHVNPLWGAELGLFYEYYCNECVAWLWFSRTWPFKDQKVKPTCADVPAPPRVNPWLWIDTEVLMGIAGIEVGVAYAFRNNPEVVAIVPVSAMAMLGASMVWANHENELTEVINSIDDIWTDLTRLFYDVKDDVNTAGKAGKRASEGILVAMAGIFTTGTVMMLTYRSLGVAGSSLLATEFMVGTVATLAVEAYVAIEKDIPSWIKKL